MSGDNIFVSESVTEGHPDKLCDGISDAIVDRFLQQDRFARVVAECAVATGIVFVAARFAANAAVDLPGIARDWIAHAGYRDEGFNPRTCSVMTSLNEQPADPAASRDEAVMTDAEIEGVAVQDQVTVFGYACRQTPALMPLPIWLAHRLARRLAAVRRDGSLPYLAPDGKTQAAVAYQDRTPRRIHGLTITTAITGERAAAERRLRDDLIEHVIRPVFADEAIGLDAGSRVFVNPGGTAVGGGPALHAGLTGRKTGVDTYGEYARQSGSALSGKDPTRIDRIGAYVARYAAKNVVAAGLADECEIQLSYAIGLARPVSLRIETFGTGRRADDAIARRVEAAIDFRLAGIIRRFRLRDLPAAGGDDGFYRRLAAYGHVGRLDLPLPWEATDAADALRD